MAKLIIKYEIKDDEESRADVETNEIMTITGTREYVDEALELIKTTLKQ